MGSYIECSRINLTNQMECLHFEGIYFTYPSVKRLISRLQKGEIEGHWMNFLSVTLMVGQSGFFPASWSQLVTALAFLLVLDVPHVES